MSPTSAEVRLHPGADLRFRGMRRGVQQGLGAHDHPGDAVAALRRLLGLKGLLDQPRRGRRTQPLDGDHLAALDGDGGQQAGEHRLAVHGHRACAALPQAAAELGPVELQVAAQHIEQRRRRFGVHRMVGAVDVEGQAQAAVSLRAAATAAGSLDQAGRVEKRARR